jgi:hypothetical protein
MEILNLLVGRREASKQPSIGNKTVGSRNTSHISKHPINQQLQTTVVYR